MKALVIGGTKGLGKEISDLLIKYRYNLVTVSRSVSGYKNYPHYSCDVANLSAWKKTLHKIKSEHREIDFLACVVGFAEAKAFADLTVDDWYIHFSRNIIYVGLALQELSNHLVASPNPRVLTIGSQWSYKTGCDVLVPYTLAKHALKTLVEDFAKRNHKIQINHYCVPTTDTPGYRVVKKTFKRAGASKIIAGFSPEGTASVKVIAKAIINKALATKATGTTFVIKSNGSIVKL